MSGVGHTRWCVGDQVGRALEVEQVNLCGAVFAYSQGFQLLHWEGLDLGGGGLAHKPQRRLRRQRAKTLLA